MKRLLPFLLLGAVACQNPNMETTLPNDVQAISLLGDTLKTNTVRDLPNRLIVRIDSLKQVAMDNNTPVEAAIWDARLLGYQGEYRDAITLLDKEIEQNPNNAALYRHRGHRYLSTRQFDAAIQDFEKAAELIEGTDDIIEQDGLPNALNQPTSTLHTNIWYHLGLAYYVTGQYEKAQNAYEKCIEASKNNDMKVATQYWYYMTLRKHGQDELAGQVIQGIEEDLEVIENDDYHKLLLVFKGVFDADKILEEGQADALSNATVGYGIGFWHHINGREERAKEVWRGVYDAGNWASFGYIASEAELASN
ncbi:tetratricopeptide repeat protein [Balneola vulgaris]|uniref:tetratricopeptide repeat protein n=1 Tax=Balneola vulgaris TaxID=287535 RepID=UPI001F08EF4E|nr:tetratricopeptide repeat protein [Balneola vulgaris]